MIAIERSIRILKVLSDCADGASVTELSDAMDAPASSVHRLLRVLVDEGFVVQEPKSRQYSIGPEALGLSRAYLSGRSFVAEARPYLEWLTEASGETTFATSVVGSVPICVAIAECDRPLRLFINIGQQMPYHAAASARAILAFVDPAAAEKRLDEAPLTAFTRATPTSSAEVMSMLPRIRRQGYAICERELDEHVTAVSAPIRAASGDVRESVTIVGPAERLEGEQRKVAARLVKEAAQRITAASDYLRIDDPRLPGTARARDPQFADKISIEDGA